MTIAVYWDVKQQKQKKKIFQLNRDGSSWVEPVHIYPSLVLVQPKKTRPCLTEILLLGRKESNQTNKQNKYNFHSK